MKKIFLEDLPRWEKGEGAGNIGSINWTKSIGYKVKFIYDDVEGWIEIIDYNSKKRKLIIKYDNKKFEILIGGIIKCQLGKLLMRRTNEFKYKIGTRLQDNKRDLTIIDRKYIENKKGYKEKYYKYKCNICGFDCREHYRNGEFKEEYWVLESNLLKNKSGCACCSNYIAVKNKNTIWDIDKWMIPIVGEEIAKKYTHGNSNKIYPTCPDCGRVKDKMMKINTIYIMHSIGCQCSDNISYPEKFIFNILEQLGLDFKTQLSKSDFGWCKNYRYDFYFKLNDEDYVIEANGMQHYEESGQGRTLKEEQLNDKLKKQLALSNGIKKENYIVIDCRKSELGFIKQNILVSRLNELFDLSIINWNVCETYALSNLVKVACEYKRNNPDLTTTEIGEIMNYEGQTIRTYLKKGSGLGWCNYSINEEEKNRKKKAGLIAKVINSKPIKMFDDNMNLIYMSFSARELDRKSKDLFDIKLNYSCISAVCLGKRNHHKNYIFKLATKEEYEQWLKQQNKQLIHNENLEQAS